jgi:hypothetical protein
MFNLGGSNERALLERVAVRRSATALFVEFDRESFARGEVRPDANVRTRASSRYVVSTVALGADLGDLFRP